MDTELLDVLSAYTWVYDPNGNKAYRVEQQGNKVVHIPLQREVFGCRPGDGRTVSFKDKNPLNCIRENLIEGPRRDLSTIMRDGNSNQWPLKPQNLINFYKKANNRRMVRLFEAAEIEKYGRRSIILRYDSRSEEGKEALLSSTITYLKESLKNDFGFVGEVSTYAGVPKAPEPESPAPAMTPTIPVAPQPEVVLTADETQMKNLAELLTKLGKSGFEVNINLKMK